MAESGGISGIGIAAVFAGGILVWSGVKGLSVSGITRDLLSGRDPSKLRPTNPISTSGLFAPIKNAIVGDINPAHLLSDTTSTGGGQNLGGNAAQNRKLGQQMAAAYGWNSGEEWAAIDWIAMHESGWRSDAANPKSNARGIAQKISGWSSDYQEGNAGQQIAWFYQYIKGRYGDPIAAKAFWEAHGWY